MRSLAGWCFRHKWIVVATWIVAVAALNGIQSSVGSPSTDNFKLPHTDSFDAIRLLQRNAPKVSGDSDQIVIGVKQGRITDAAAGARIEATLAAVAREPHVTRVDSPFGP